MLTLYHHNSSVCAAKIRVALAEKRLKWHSEVMQLDGDQFAPTYLALNPAAVVPTLIHGDTVVTESNVILEYLEDAFPDQPLRPDTPAARADARQLMMRLDQGLEGLHHAASVLTYAIAYRMRLVEAAGGTDPARLGPVIDAQMNAKSRAWLEDVVYRGTDAPIVRDCLARFDQLIGDFEHRLTQRDWLAGDRYSIAEAAFTSYMMRLELLHLDFLWRRRPAVAAWLEGLKARPSAKEVLDWYDPENLDILDTQGRALSGRVEALLT